MTRAALVPIATLRVLFVGGTKLTNDDIAELAAAHSRCRIDWDGGTIPATPDYDRIAAELAVKLGGAVAVNDGVKPIRTLDELPEELFRLTRVGWHKNPNVTDETMAALKNCKHLANLHVTGVFRASPPLVTDAGMANFKGRTNLKQLALNETQITDVGLANFKDCKGLTDLVLSMTATTDAGLVHFKDCADLETLDLSYIRVTDTGLGYFTGCKGLKQLVLEGCTLVTDAGFDQLKGCANLTYLRVKFTKVTGAKIAELSKALPRCKIEWDGGIIEPRTK